MEYFNHIVKRVNNFSIQSFYKNQNILEFFKENQLFQLAILHASESLYETVIKDNDAKTISSLKKYFKRAHFNSTPFGVFSSVGLLKWGDETNIKKEDSIHLTIKYDNKFLSNALFSNLENDWLNKKYTLNPTVRLLNNKINFYKSVFLKNESLNQNYIELDYDDDLAWIINKFKIKTPIFEIKEEIILNGFSEVDVNDYLYNLIVVGLVIEDFLFSPYNSKLFESNNIFDSKIIKNKFRSLKNDSEIHQLKKLLIEDRLNFGCKENNVKDSHSINTYETEIGKLDKDTQIKINKIIDFTINYNSAEKQNNISINKFIEKLNANFNEGFISLNRIFNPNIGLKYTENEAPNSIKLHEELQKLILDCNNKLVHVISKEVNLEVKKNNLPASFSVLIEKLTCKSTGKKIVLLKEIGFESALNVISRFDNLTNSACQEIVNYEKEIHYGKLIAELNFIGDLRSVNIRSHNQYYDYNIPINTSNILESKQIFLSDLYIHLNNNNCVLVSKKHKKQIIVRRTSAVNYQLHNSEINAFLINFSLRNEEIYAINLNFNAYDFEKEYVPRIYLDDDVLLHVAQLKLVNNNLNFEDFKNYLNQVILKFEFTTIVSLTDSTGTLILDTKIDSDVIILLESIKNKKRIYVSEFLYKSFTPDITNGKEDFAHELVISVKNPHYYRETIDYSNIDIFETQETKIPIVDDWLYLEIFCNSYADSEIHKFIHEKIILKNKCDLFFFINYANPDRHIRLRFKTKSLRNKKYIIQKISELKQNNYISKYQIIPYEPETYRYGGQEMMELSESIFDLDSRDFLQNVVGNELEENDLKIVGVLKLKNYLQFFNFSLESSINYCEQCILNYSKEFELTGQLRKDFNKEYSEIKNNISNYEYGSFFRDESFKENYHQQLKISNVDVFTNTWLLIHMSMNRHFNENQRFNEFKIYYLTKCYLNQLKFQKPKEV